MSIGALPTYTNLLWPTLVAVRDLGGQASTKQINDTVVSQSAMTPSQVAEEYGEDSTQTGSKVHHRIAWARTYLKRAGLLASVTPGVWAITEEGYAVAALGEPEGATKARALVEQSTAAVEPDASTWSEWEAAAPSSDPAAMTVRELIKHWGGGRRWVGLVARINAQLADHALDTEPDFSVVGLDDSVQIVSTSSDAVEGDDGVAAAQATRTVGQVPSASRGVEAVPPEAMLVTAHSTMRVKDYSQLAVMKNEWNVIGAISWESIARKLVLTANAGLADCLIPDPTVVKFDTPLLNAVPHIAAEGFVFVRGPDGKISGIVTAADLAEEFSALASPFLLVAEIESWLRIVLDRHFDAEALAEHVDPGDSDREIEAAYSLTLGEVVRIFQSQATWDKLGWPADRKVFNSALDEVRQIRNAVMHFSPDPAEDSDLDRMRAFLEWIRNLAALVGNPRPE